MAGFLSVFQSRHGNANSHKGHGLNAAVEYKVSSRAKRVSLKMDNARRKIIVTYPGPRSRSAAEKFVIKQNRWIADRLAELPPPQPFVDGGTILFQGRPFALSNPGGRGRPHMDKDGSDTLIMPAPAGALAGRTRRFLIREARTALEAAVENYAAKAGRPFGRITVRDTASRWGSCASNGNLNFSWRLICAPPDVLDYVAAHECAHLVHPNHSSRFWALNEQLYGDLSGPRRWLKNNGALLFAVGADV